MRLLIGLVRLLGLALAFAAFGCFAPGDPPACGLRCGPGGLCPDGTSCQDDGYCHLPGTPRCGDAAVVVEDGGDPPDAALHDGGAVDAAVDAASTPAVISVFVGPRSTCFVRADKSAWCMGANDVGQLGDGSQIARHVPTRVTGSFRTIRPAYFGTCAISDVGALLCWGSNAFGRLGLGQAPASALPAEPLPGTTWLDVALGFTHGCGVQADGSLWCWGDNQLGQLGKGAVSGPVNTPTRIAAGPFTAVSAISSTTCALQQGGTLYCWGDNAYGQVGNGRSGGPEAAPVRVDGSFRAVSVGELHACAIADDGRLACWGASNKSQAGALGGPFTRPMMPVPGTDWVEVTCGARHTCARRKDGTISCMGDDERGQSGGGGGGGDGLLLHRVGSDSDWSAISASGYATCGLRGAGELYCFGANGDGQLGQGVAGSHDRPFHVDDGWLQVRFGGNFGCGLRNDGTLHCWGQNAFGQLGVSDYLARARATRVGAGTFTRFAAGRYHVCAVTPKASLECWGAGNAGELAGAAARVNHPVPADPGMRSWLDVAAGDSESCGITADNRLRCWGAGVGSSTITEVGSKVPMWSAVACPCALAGARLSCDLATQEAAELVPGTAWADLGRGGFLDGHACAIRKDGTLWCWGANSFGQLGDGTYTPRAAPVKVNAPVAFVAVAAGAYFTVAIGGDGKLYSWGAVGPRLGNGGAEALVPTVAQGDTDWLDVSAGDNAACGIKGQNRERWCWGDMDALGDGTGFYTTPTRVP